MPHSHIYRLQDALRWQKREQQFLIYACGKPKNENLGRPSAAKCGEREREAAGCRAGSGMPAHSEATRGR
jgi:hypothetical protein